MNVIKYDLILIIFGRILLVTIGLVSLRFLTGSLSPEEYGKYSLIVSIQAFCGLFLINPVAQYISLNANSWFAEKTLLTKLNDYKKYVLLVSAVGSLLVFILWLNQTSELFFVTMLAMFAIVMAGAWNSILVWLLNMLGFRYSSIFWLVVTAIVGLLSSVLLVKYIPSAVMWFVGQSLGLVFGGLGAWVFFRKSLAHMKTKKNGLPLLNKHILFKYCLPLSLATGFMWLQLNGYRFVVEKYWGLASLGFLTLGLQLSGQIFAVIESLAMQFLYPSFFKRIDSRENELLNLNLASEALSDLVNVMVPVYFLLTAITFISAPYLLKLLVAHQYASAEVYVKLGIILEFCRVMANLLSNAAQATKRTSKVILPYALGALSLLFMLAIAGFLNFGIIAVAACLVVSTLIMLATMWHAMSNEVKFHPDFKLWIIAILMAVAIALSSLWLPKETLWFNSLAILLLISVIGLISLMLILRNNKALQRLLITTLQSKSI